MTRLALSGDQHVEAFHMTTAIEQEFALKRMVSEAAQRRCSTLVLLGDATHTRRPGPVALGIWGRTFELCREAGIDVIAVKGNHEGEDVANLFAYFRGQITVAVEPCIVTARGKCDRCFGKGLSGQDDAPGILLPAEDCRACGGSGMGRSVDIACLPWLPDSFVRARGAGELTRDEVASRLTFAASDILRGFVAKKRPGVPLMLATHATIAGAETSTGFNMGYAPATGYILRREDLEGFDFVAAGHIHKRQAVDGRDDPAAHPRIVYTGSLLPLDFSEWEPKGFIVADFDGTHLSPSLAFVEVPTAHVVTWDLEDAAVAQLCRGDMPELAHLNGAKMRVRVHCSEATAREYPPARIAQALRDVGAVMVQVELDVVRPERPRGHTLELAPIDALDSYINTRKDLTDDDKLRIETKAAEVLTIELATRSAFGDLDLLAIDVEDFLGVRRGNIALHGEGIHSLTGPVGSGKSTVGVDAIRYALFGESRIGAKFADRLVRNGADQATAAVTLRAGDTQFKIIRKTKRSARGATTSLDVLADGPTLGPDRHWRPLGTGKIADGEEHVRRILGELDDETLCVANLVVQRSADAFSRARPEERKRLIAQAAGLFVYEDLARSSQDALSKSERALDALHSKASPLRQRAGQIPEWERIAATLAAELEAASTQAGELERTVADRRTELEAVTERVAEYDAKRREVATLKAQIDEVDGELREWDHKRRIADALILARPALIAARADIDKERKRITALELEADAAHASNTARATRQREADRMRFTLAEVRAAREREVAQVSALIDAAQKQSDRLTNAECSVIEQITSGAVPPCVFLRDAKHDVDGIQVLADRLALIAEPGEEELEQMETIIAFEGGLPAYVDVGQINATLSVARDNLVIAEKNAAAADKISAAEVVVAHHDEAKERLGTKRGDITGKVMELDGALAELGNPRADLTNAKWKWEEATAALDNAKKQTHMKTIEVTQARTRLDTLREAATDLEAVEAEIEGTARDVAAWEELVRAWRACRVMVLEGSVIPGIEEQANDILRRFPYGLQIALRTQRETRAGGQAETLDVEVLGGRGGLYELCSGGERTTIDTALHIAIALIVARRASTRLRFIVVDEPEGLDEPGRMAFAAVMRWIHETHRLTVIAMSHMPDLVDALGGERIVAIPSDDGSEVRAA